MSVTDIEPSPRQRPEKLPAVVYVENFRAPAENVRAGRAGAQLALFQYELGQALARNLRRQIDRNLARAEVPPKVRALQSADAWVITGTFEHVDQGSRALRGTIGFGAGRTRMVTTAHVSVLSPAGPRRFLTIRTAGGSNVAPGAVMVLPALILNPAGWIFAAPGGLGSFGPGLSEDSRRTAREIAAALSAYCADLGLIPRTQAMKPKLAGRARFPGSTPRRPRTSEAQ